MSKSMEQLMEEPEEADTGYMSYPQVNQPQLGDSDFPRLFSRREVQIPDPDDELLPPSQATTSARGQPALPHLPGFTADLQPKAESHD